MPFHKALRKGMLPFAVTSVIALSTPSAVMAATQGDPARAPNGSAGTTNMTMTVPKLIRITGLADVDITENEVFTAIDTATPHTELVDACVGGNGTFTYAITIASDTGAYQLAANDGSGNTAVPFSVDWKAAPTAHNTALGGQVLDRENLEDAATVACENPGNLAVTVSDTDLSGARVGTYASTLTLTVVPE
jgi:hypothetical protein